MGDYLGAPGAAGLGSYINTEWSLDVSDEDGTLLDDYLAGV